MEKYRNSLVTQYYRNTEGVVLVYDVTRLESFTSIEDWIGELRTYCNKHSQVSMLLIGNKLDKAAEGRKVSLEMGQSLADRHGMSFVEISAIELDSLSKLEESVHSLAREMLRRRDEDDRMLSSSVIRVVDMSEWEVLSAPSGSVPRASYTLQDRMARRPRNRIRSAVASTRCGC